MADDGEQLLLRCSHLQRQVFKNVLDPKALTPYKKFTLI